MNYLEEIAISYPILIIYSTPILLSFITPKVHSIVYEKGTRHWLYITERAAFFLSPFIIYED